MSAVHMEECLVISPSNADALRSRVALALGTEQRILSLVVQTATEVPAPRSEAVAFLIDGTAQTPEELDGHITGTRVEVIGQVNGEPVIHRLGTTVHVTMPEDLQQQATASITFAD